MIDPYQTLGIRRNASKKTVKSVFHRKVKTAHPDCGGSAERLQEVKLAYEILNDEARRAQYDRTGSYEEKKPDNQRAVIMGILAPVLDHVINEALGTGRQPEKLDLVRRMRETIETARRQGAGAVARLRQEHANLSKLLGRFSTDGEENLLEGHLRSRIAQVEESVRGSEAELAKVDTALAFLAQYKFRADAPPPNGDLITSLLGMRATTNTYTS
jgi:curved DNA-binding protein CbpA